MALVTLPHLSPTIPPPPLRLTDTYSFGMVAYEVLSKRKPYQGMTVDTHREICCREGQRPTPLKLPIGSLIEECWAQEIDGAEGRGAEKESGKGGGGAESEKGGGEEEGR